MNITLFKKHITDEGLARFNSDIFHSYYITPMKYCGGLFTDHTDGKAAGGSAAGYYPNAEHKLSGDLTLQTIPISYNEIEDAEGMFFGQSAINNIKIDFPNVKNMSYMFAYCQGLESIESTFSSVTGENLLYGSVTQNSAANPFYNCHNIKTFKCNFPKLVSNSAAIGIFNQLPKVETIESDLSSLTDGNDLFATNICLTNLNCNFSSLNSANNLCPKAKLTVESVKNIANNIKPHDSGTHKISLGINLNTNEGYSISEHKEHIDRIVDKGWSPSVYDKTGLLIYDSSENIFTIPNTENIVLDSYNNPSDSADLNKGNYYGIGFIPSSTIVANQLIQYNLTNSDTNNVVPSYIKIWKLDEDIINFVISPFTISSEPYVMPDNTKVMVWNFPTTTFEAGQTYIITYDDENSDITPAVNYKWRFTELLKRKSTDDFICGVVSQGTNKKPVLDTGWAPRFFLLNIPSSN